MNNRHNALQFVERFCAGEVEGLAGLLAEDLQLKGPLHRFDSRDAYLASLGNDPPEKSGYRLLSVTEGDERVAVLYDYEKPDGSLTVAQSFKMRDGKITELLIVFDTAELA